MLPQAVLIAGFAYPIPNVPNEPGAGIDPILQPDYNWPKIKQQVRDIIFINSVNDPWGCNDKQGRFMFDKLGGTQIIRNDGHFGSTTTNQPYKTFELLDRLVA